MTRVNPTNLFGFSPYIVDAAASEGSYTTVQSALNAANAAGGGIVYVRPGTYTEDLTLFVGTEVVGIPASSSSQNIVIHGVHTPPAAGAGTFSFTNLFLTSASDVFNSVAAGDTVLTVQDCNFNINGYIFNLPNWTADINILSCKSNASTNDGVLNGTAVFLVLTIENSTVGDGTNTLTSVSDSNIINSTIGCKTSFDGLFSFTNTTFLQQMTLTGGATGFIIGCLLSTNTTSVLVYDSTNPTSIESTTINGSMVPVIAGTGTGLLSLGGITWGESSSMISGLAILYIKSTFGTGMKWQGTVGDLTAGANEGWIIVGGIAPVIITLPAVAYPGDMVSISGRGTNWRLGQNAGQSVNYGAMTTTGGVGGSISSTLPTDQLDVICQTANTGWAVRNSVGNLTVV